MLKQKSPAKGKRKTQDPCGRCGLHKVRCICASIPRVELKTRVLLVVHAKELKRTTNTGKLALEALPNSKLVVRGEGRESLDLTAELEGAYESVLLYPGEDSIPLADLRSTKPVQLIVPDGNWRQAAKVGTRHPELAPLKRVKIPQPNPSGHHLRKEHFEEGRSTLEAIAEAIKILEGSEAAQPLFDLYQAKLMATLKGRPVSSKRTDE